MVLDKNRLFVRVLLFCCIIAMLPFLTSCGQISIGFPAMIYSWETHHFSAVSLIIDVTCVALLFLLFLWFFKKIKDPAITVGLWALAAYHAVYLFTFGLLLFLNYFRINSIPWWIPGSLIVVLLWPFFIFEILGVSGSSIAVPQALYHDSIDLLTRASYLISVVAFFFMAYWIARLVYARRDARGANPKPSGNRSKKGKHGLSRTHFLRRTI